MSPVLAQILACQTYKQTSSPGRITLAQERPTFEAHCTQFAPTQRLSMWDPLLARSRACLARAPPRCRQASSALVSMAPVSIDQLEPPKRVPCGPITSAWPLPTPNQLLQPLDCSNYGKGVRHGLVSTAALSSPPQTANPITRPLSANRVAIPSPRKS